MAAGGLGNLTVFLGLDAAEFDRGLTQSELKARRFGEAIGTGINRGVTAAIGSLGALTAAATGAFAFLSNQAESIAAYQEIADKIGTTAAEVTKLQLAADLSGTALKTLEAGSVKLTSALTKSDDEAKGAAAGLAAIGIEAKAFRELDPVAQYQEIAKALDGYADGAEKTAVATALWGKSGADMLPFLKDLAEEGEQQVRLSEDQIAAADEYSKKMARQKSELTALAQIVSAESIPAIEALTGAITDSAKEFLGLDEGTKNLRDNQFIRDWAGNAAVFLGEVADLAVNVATRIRVLGNTLGGLAAAGTAVARGEIKQAGQIMALMREDNLRMLGGLDGPGIADRVRARLAAAGATPSGVAPGAKPRINTAGLAVGSKAGGGGDDALKKQLDNELKLIQNAQKAEEELLRDRNKMLDLYNGESLLSFADYYTGRRTAAEESLRNQIALLDQEIAKLQAYQSTAAKATEREGAQGKINDLLEKKAKLQRDAGVEGITLAFQEAKAYRDLQRQIDGVRASLLDLAGQSGAAAGLRFDGANEDLRNRLVSQGDPVAVMQLDRLRTLTVAQADYNDQAEQAAQIQARLQIAEQRITTAQQLGTTGELEGLLALGKARQDALKQMESMVAAQEAVAKASGSNKLQLQAEQARAALDQLQAVADPLGQKFASIFESGFGSAFADFITGSKSASDAFRSFGQTVVSQLANIAAQSVARSIFGGAGGLGSLFSGLFGGGSVGNAGFGDYSAAGLAAAFGGGRQVGGTVSPDKFYRVNEAGPELYEQGGRQYLMTGGRGGRITPLGGGAGAAAEGAGMSFTMINHSGVPLTAGPVERISPTERRMIVDDARRQTMAQVRAELQMPNSKTARSLTGTYKVQRNMR